MGIRRLFCRDSFAAFPPFRDKTAEGWGTQFHLLQAHPLWAGSARERLSCPAQADGEPALRVGPVCDWREARFGQHRLRRDGGVLVAVLGVEVFARREIDF